MSRVLTKEGLWGSLIAALELGYRACEKGHNLQYAIDEFAKSCANWPTTLSNLPREIIRIERKR